MNASESGYVYGSVYVSWNKLSVVNKKLKKIRLIQNEIDQGCTQES